jgi:5'-methylthioadenosine phosphorylase
MSNEATLLLLVGVLLPPQALSALGDLLEERVIETPYGPVGPLARRQPSSGASLWVEPYTGIATRTDPRATLWAARTLGVRRILNWDTGVALDPTLRRGRPLIVADYIDGTRRTPNTFGEPGSNEHLHPMAARPPFCPQMTAALFAALPGVAGGVYLGVDGPRRETPAEARMYRAWGADVIGTNLVPEVSLAHELGLCYAGLVTVADYGAEATALPQVGEVRAGLEITFQSLLAFLQHMAAAPGCATCSLE